MKKEKDKDLKIAQTKIEEQEKEIARLQSLLAHSSAQQQPQQQQSSIQVVSVPTVDEQGCQSYPAQPDAQYRQAIYQQQAYQQNIIPNQIQNPTVSQVPINHTIPSHTMLNSEAMNAKLDPFSGAQSDSIPYAAQIPKSLLFKHVKVKQDTFTLNNDNQTTILFDPLVNKGIVKFVVQSIFNLSAVGIADETVKYERKEYPWARGNAEFNTGDRVTLELNMDSSPRTFTFFVNDEEQPNYVSNIPAAVRVWALLWQKGDAFKVIKFEALSAPTAKHGAGSRAWEFGKQWKKDK